MSAMTLEEVLAVIDRRTAEDRVKWQAELSVLNAEIAKAEAERAKAEAARVKAEAERDKAEAEYKAVKAKADAEYKAERAKADAKFEAYMKRTDKLTGSLKNNMSQLIELLLMPLIREKMNDLGHKFYVLSPNKEYHYENGYTMAEVDLLLENGDEVMAIEVKSNYKIKDVKEHLKQVELLRKYEPITGMRGRAIYAAIAGITIKKDVRELALNSGMYVITMCEEEDKVEVIPPVKKKRW